MTLWGLFALQAFCAVFFGLDAVLDWLGLEAETGLREIDSFEFGVAFALIVGLGFTYREIRQAMDREKRLRDQIRAASGEFSALLEEHFRDWGLSRAERDVALLAIKGMSIAEIAALRQTKEGTVKAQNAAVYRKAGVSGRHQLLTYFIEEMMAEAQVPA